MSERYTIESLGNHDLPADMSRATDADVEIVLRRAATFIGVAEISIAHVASVIGGSCIGCTDIVAYANGTPMLVAKPALY